MGKKFKIPSRKTLNRVIREEVTDMRVALLGRFYDVSQPESVEAFVSDMSDWVEKILARSNRVDG